MHFRPILSLVNTWFLLCNIRKLDLPFLVCCSSSCLSSCHCNTAVTHYCPAFQHTQPMLPINNTTFKVVRLPFFNTIQPSVITVCHLQSKLISHYKTWFADRSRNINQKLVNVSRASMTHGCFSKNSSFFVWLFCLYYDRTVSRQEAKREREGGRIRERSESWVVPQDNRAILYMSARCP